MMLGHGFTVFLLLTLFNLNQIECSDNSQKKVPWNTFRLRWGPNPATTDGRSYIRQPRTIQQAMNEGYKKLPTPLEDQCTGRSSVGFRYWKSNDTSAILIFDKQGTISGVQLAFPRSKVDHRFYRFNDQKLYTREMIDGTEMYTLTAYFVKPETICSTGRNSSQLEKEGTGVGLFIQNGTNPLTDYVTVPLSEDQVKSTKWVRGACFPTMGNHYWYDNRLDLDCTQFLPAFLLYNKGQLTGFGWAVANKIDLSHQAEYPQKEAILSFLIPVPSCMMKMYDDVGGFTTMHLYFNTDQGNLDC